MLGTPFGGNKLSGYGREHCIETLREWSQPKAVHTPSGLGEVPTWRVVKDIFGASGSDIKGAGENGENGSNGYSRNGGLWEAGRA